LAEASAARKPPEERKRPIDEAVTWALGHWIRNEALSILAEGRHSTSEIAKIMGLDVKLVGNHIRDLYDCGCIEFAGSVKKGNVTETYYRAVRLPYITDEAYRSMSAEARRDVNGVTVQSILTETLASFRAGRMETDEDLVLLWDALHLDAQGKRELADHLAATYEGVLEIKARNATRLAELGETGATTIITLTGFERSRPGRPDRGYSPSIES
jgi:hypothetical protein